MHLDIIAASMPALLPFSAKGRIFHVSKSDLEWRLLNRSDSPSVSWLRQPSQKFACKDSDGQRILAVHAGQWTELQNILEIWAYMMTDLSQDDIPSTRILCGRGDLATWNGAYLVRHSVMTSAFYSIATVVATLILFVQCNDSM